MTRMTGPDCVVMCNLINTYIHTQEEGHTEFFIHLPSAVRAFIFLARTIQPFVSLVDREVEFCVLPI